MQSNTWSEDSLLDTNVDFEFDGERLTGIIRQQEIPQSFLDDLAKLRDHQDHNAFGNFALAARIPTSVVEHWMRQGFNIFDKNITVADIVKRLKTLELDKFLATRKRL